MVITGGGFSLENANGWSQFILIDHKIVSDEVWKSTSGFLSRPRLKKIGLKAR